VNRSILRRRTAPAAAAVAFALTLAACGGEDAGDATTNIGTEQQQLSGTVRADGSSTVAPLTTVASELYKDQEPGVDVTVGTSGTGGGFEKFCAGETEISNASRPIDDEEKAICEENGIESQELTVANDALTVVVNKENDWATCLTVEQLNAIWEPGSEVNNWNQVDPSFPDEELALFGPGTDSGTFDYFTDAVNGEEGASRTDYDASEDDNVIVQGVSGTPGGLGYFGFTYYEENQDALTAVEIDGGDGCVAPSSETVQDGTYVPLARPLFIYASTQAMERPEVKAFIEFYVENIDQIAEEALYVPLNEEQKTELQSTLDTLTS